MSQIRYTNSMKKLAVFDIDGTLFRWQLYHELVFELKARHHFSQAEAAALDDALISWQAKHISWRDYERLVIQTIEDNITAIEPRSLEQAAKAVVERSGHKIYGYTAKLLKELQAADYRTVALSGSQQEIAEQFAARYGFDVCIASQYQRVDGRYTGEKSRYVPGHKDTIIGEYLAAHPEVGLVDSIAIGDSDGDIGMLQMVEQPIAFNPSEELLAVATDQNWKIVIERKNVAYTLENRDESIVLAQTDCF